MGNDKIEQITPEDFIVSGSNKITYADAITVAEGKQKNISLRNTFGEQVLYHSAIDSKGRLFLPAEVQAFLGKILYITIFDKDCLAMYSAERWKTLLDKINALPVSPQKKMRPFLSIAIKCEVDNQGYIYIPEKLGERVELTSGVTIAMYNKAQYVWDSEIWASKKWEEDKAKRKGKL